MPGEPDPVAARRDLVGRDAVVDAVTASLRGDDSLGALVIGEPGLGKTALAQRVLLRLGATRTALRITTSRTLADVPFGALAPYLGSLPPGEAGSPWAVLHALQSEIRRQLDGTGPGLLVVDDAHDLDPSSANAIAQLAATEGVRLFVLSRPKPAPPPEFVSMWTEGLLSRVDLDPLDLQQSQQVCEQALGGSVTSGSAALLHAASSGNPMFLLAHLVQGRQQQQLVERNGVWVLTKERPSEDPVLLDLVREQLLRRSAAEIEVLETVALVEPLPLPVLLKLTDVEAIDALEESHLIRVSEAPDRVVTLAYPLFGDVLRQHVPAGRSLTLHQRMSALLVTDGLSDAALLRHVSWSLQCGVEVPDEVLLRAARVATRCFDFDLAHHTAELVMSPERLGAARLETAKARFHRGDVDGAVALIDAPRESEDGPDVVTATALLRGLVQLRSGADPERLRSIWTTDSTVVPVVPRPLDGREASAVRSDSTPTRADAPSAAATDECAAMAQLLWAENSMALGRFHDAEQALRTALAHLDALAEPMVLNRQQVMLEQAWCLMELGHWSTLKTLIDAWTSAASTDLLFFGGSLDLVRAMAHFRRGELRRALDTTVLAVEALRHNDPAQLLSSALALGAYTASVLDERELAGRFAHDADTAGLPGRWRHRLSAEAYLVASRAADLGATETVRALSALRCRARDAALHGVEAEIVVLSIRLGDSSGWTRLSAVTADGQGERAELLHALATGVLNRDGVRLMSVSERAGTAGYGLLAAECVGHAVRFFDAHGDRSGARSALRVLQWRRSLLDGASSAVLATPNGGPRLTPRELDIARLVLAGRSNRDIAARLSLSLRTVEGHLYRIFSKLSINHREELCAAHLKAPMAVHSA